MKIEAIYDKVQKLISRLLAKESQLQGHTLSKTMEDSFGASQKATARARILTGTAIEYTKYVNDGVKAESATFKQAPFLIEYFKQRGYDEKDATSFAFATIKKWMKEGMSTQASKRFSKTGARQNMVESAFIGGDTKIDQLMHTELDRSIDENYRLTKSETV